MCVWYWLPGGYDPWQSLRSVNDKVGYFTQRKKEPQEKKLVFHQSFNKVQTFFDHFSHLPSTPLEPGLVDATGTWSLGKFLTHFRQTQGLGNFPGYYFHFRQTGIWATVTPLLVRAQGKISPCICCEDCLLRSSDSLQVSSGRASLDVRFIHIIFLIPYWLCRQAGFGESLTSSVLTLSWFLTTNWINHHLFQDFFFHKIPQWERTDCKAWLPSDINYTESS